MLGLLVAGVGGAGAAAGPDDKASAAAEPIVQTAYGKVRGQNVDGVFAFKGVPYGGSTAGANPNNPKLPAWPAYDAKTKPTMVFDTDTRVVNDPKKELRGFWADAAP